ncbi:unnamed protein product [Euphydryas editha]|uniref:Beta-glucosidase n=1 Tax=Euphydryas editha TaxID=104508 RepID=A0AAU9UF73_EUPED|nr:unnamed protein product [Euphydryas editha]
MGLNFYTSRTVRDAKSDIIGVWPFLGSLDINVILGVRREWNNTGAWWFYITPEGIRKQLAWLKKEYGDIEILVTENGCASDDAKLDDEVRVQYYKDYLEQVLLSINVDGVRVMGYTAWALMDNYEWNDGYSIKFGLHHVDFENPNRTRTPRASADYYASVVKSHSLDVNNKTIDKL